MTTAYKKQYKDIKQKHPDCVLLFRHGDFYEAYDSDADIVADVLGLIVTVCKGDKVVGFPHHALDIYLPKLVRAGKRVAICDQLEKPKKTNKLYKTDDYYFK